MTVCVPVELETKTLSVDGDYSLASRLLLKSDLRSSVHDQLARDRDDKADNYALMPLLLSSGAGHGRPGVVGTAAPCRRRTVVPLQSPRPKNCSPEKPRSSAICSGQQSDLVTSGRPHMLC